MKNCGVAPGGRKDGRHRLQHLRFRHLLARDVGDALPLLHKRQRGRRLHPSVDSDDVVDVVPVQAIPRRHEYVILATLLQLIQAEELAAVGLPLLPLDKLEDRILKCRQARVPANVHVERPTKLARRVPPLDDADALRQQRREVAQRDAATAPRPRDDAPQVGPDVRVRQPPRRVQPTRQLPRALRPRPQREPPGRVRQPPRRDGVQDGAGVVMHYTEQPQERRRVRRGDARHAALRQPSRPPS